MKKRSYRNINLGKEVVTFQKRWRPIPKPFYVMRCDDHFMVCELDEEMNLVHGLTVLHWNPFVVRRWALDLAMKRPHKGV